MTVRASGELRDFYERPETPVSAAQDRAARLVAFLREITAASSGELVIADVGCGDGGITRMAADAAPGHRVIGMDWAMAPLETARAKGLTVMRGTAAHPGLPLASASVDVVVFSEVIEHLVDPDAAILELHRVLRPGGHLLLSTPNLAAWFNRGMLALGRQPVFSEVSMARVFGRPGQFVAGHLRLFTLGALKEFLVAYGFADLRVRGACYHDVPGPLRPLDRLFRSWPAASAILTVHARKPH
ncbi:class I SAM-dependent methyltransferase [Planobispora longispora]|uniref:class I SAM-dependent methyltransferase n=1 Tax=Planobispora longispora TaxID=28887 RepID=UPI0019437585|nr:class I SAM-dependent methyltransferase [Planobispora longispora]